MSILTDDIMEMGHCLADERFEFIINEMNWSGYNYVKARESLKRTAEEVKHRFWVHENSIDIIKERIENYPICNKPIETMLAWIEYTVFREIKMKAGYVSKRKDENAVFAILKIADSYVRMLSICIKEKSSWKK